MFYRILQFYRSLIDSPAKAMKVFGICATVFFGALGMIYSLNKSMQPSLQQEISLFLFVLIGATAFTVAISCHICMIINRFKNLGK